MDNNLTKDDWSTIRRALIAASAATMDIDDKRNYTEEDLQNLVDQAKVYNELALRIHRGELREKPPVRVIVEIEGGCFQAVHSSEPISFDVLDHDNMMSAAEDPDGGEEFRAYLALQEEIKTMEAHHG